MQSARKTTGIGINGIEGHMCGRGYKYICANLVFMESEELFCSLETVILKVVEKGKHPATSFRGLLRSCNLQN